MKTLKNEAGTSYIFNRSKNHKAVIEWFKHPSYPGKFTIHYYENNKMYGAYITEREPKDETAYRLFVNPPKVRIGTLLPEDK